MFPIRAARDYFDDDDDDVSTRCDDDDFGDDETTENRRAFIGEEGGDEMIIGWMREMREMREMVCEMLARSRDERAAAAVAAVAAAATAADERAAPSRLDVLRRIRTRRYSITDDGGVRGGRDQDDNVSGSDDEGDDYRDSLTRLNNGQS
jgi:hypothetical protein